MWVQLKSGLNLERQGKPRMYHAGDWVDVGKQYALRLIAEGKAWLPEMKVGDFLNDKDAGIIILGHQGAGLTALGDFKDDLNVVAGRAELKWTLTMLYDPTIVLRTTMIPIGFSLLEKWQVVCPLLPYETLAENVGDGEDRKRTLAMIGDLRVPLYDWRLCFIKRCDDTEWLMNVWDEESTDSHDAYHSFLRAMYRAKPLVLALPPNWCNPNYRSSADDW